MAALAGVVFSPCPASPHLARVQPSPRARAGLAAVLWVSCTACIAALQNCVHGAHAGRRTNRLGGGHTGGGSGAGGGDPASKLLPLAAAGGGALVEDGGQDGDAAAVI